MTKSALRRAYLARTGPKRKRQPAHRHSPSKQRPAGESKAVGLHQGAHIDLRGDRTH
ncbi:hypothetical protein [Streptomyces sp. NBC_00470]|uniref:hypothetical protein n=1 Tax=Streptomyces sp. NBC_00470 TaxID=2975753 RepID=UPI002F918560